ncbi:DUF4242 domain-containing protein [Mucilaginibacter sp. UYCu711]|uniref:DUF4242 domain-containing protein n=1 Tax=Mucilaginibacter sp. UYCu711 TaxID=3156339 RepID=UPI003D24CD20
MKTHFLITALIAVTSASYQSHAQANKVNWHKNTPHQKNTTNFYMDIHHFGPGKVSYEDVAQAHEKDLAVQKKHGVKFINFWLNEKDGTVYCLSSAKNSRSVVDTHSEAHGLLPDEIFLVKGSLPRTITEGKLFMDIHHLGTRVKVNDVEKAHQKDLASQTKFGANFLNYWVNEKTGTIFCLSQSPDSSAIINTHKAAHGLIPAKIEEVKQGVRKTPTAYLNNHPLYFLAHYLIVSDGGPLYQSLGNLIN